MPVIKVKTRDGVIIKVEAGVGVKIMQAIRAAGIDELTAMCGGFCSCATCHVKIDAAYARLLPAMEEDEDALLDCVLDRDEHSRLSCQILVTEAMDGLELVIPQEA